MATNEEPNNNTNTADEVEQEHEEQKQDVLDVVNHPVHQPEPQKYEKKWRAKLYQLNNEGGWDDLGTGYSHIDTSK